MKAFGFGPVGENDLVIVKQDMEYSGLAVIYGLLLFYQVLVTGIIGMNWPIA